MNKKMKFVAIMATLLIAAAGVITFEACNKTNKTSVEPTTVQIVEKLKWNNIFGLVQNVPVVNVLWAILGF